MNRVMTFLAILLLSLPLCAMKRIADSDLSLISGPASLSISFDQTLDIDNGPLAWGSSYYISRALSSSGNSYVTNQGGEEGKTTETDEANGQSSSVSLEDNGAGNGFQRLWIPRLTLRGNKLTYSDIDEYDPYDTSSPQLETRSSDGVSIGRSFSETNPKFYDIRPDGSTQLRMYYTGTVDYTVLPQSTLDIWVH